jgi:peptide/histidine transporter 3/4
MKLQEILFFVSPYIVVVGQGGHKSCVQASGADQFDGQDPEECKAESLFFNWWYFGLSAGSTMIVMMMSYIHNNLSLSLGFGIPYFVMIFCIGYLFAQY